MSLIALTSAYRWDVRPTHQLARSFAALRTNDNSSSWAGLLHGGCGNWLSSARMEQRVPNCTQSQRVYLMLRELTHVLINF